MHDELGNIEMGYKRRSYFSTNFMGIVMFAIVIAQGFSG